MEQNKSPFEEIFKKEKDRKEQKKKEQDESILDALDEEEKSVFDKPSNSGSVSLEKKNNEGEGLSEEERYLRLLNELIERHYFEEAMSVVGEMKKEFGE